MKKSTLDDFEKNHTKKLKSWRYSLALLFGMFFMAIPNFAQTIQVGSGSATGSYLPIYYLFDKNYTQTIYTAAELTNAGATATGGVITKIRFKPTASVSTEKWRNWKIFLGNTSKASFTSTSDWIPIGSLTPVFDGSLQDNAVANTWIEITLNTPFAWNGSNVAVAITETTPSYGNSPNWASYTLAPATGNKAIYKWQDGPDIDINTPPLGTLINVVAQIQFDGTLQAPCEGTPSGGIASLAPANGNSGSTFTAFATGSTSGSGLAYQWQKEIGGTWQNITGAITKSSQITSEVGPIGTVTNYRLAVTCTASGETAYSTAIPFTIALTYCTPLGGANNADEIKNFTLNNLSNTSAPSEGVLGYKNYSGIVAPAQLQLNVPYIATITGGTGTGNHGAAIWIDYNKNGTFESSEKVAFIGNTIGESATASFPEFSIPPGTAIGIYRLRVQHQYNKSGELLDPCTISSTNAETEDYDVQVFPIPTCIQPAALAATDITFNSAVLSWTSTGSSFEIQVGTQGFVLGSVPTITGASSPYTLNTGLLPATSYSYYVRQNCGTTDGYSLWTGPFTFKTECAPVSAFLENFDSYTLTGVNNPLPNCWTKFGNVASSYITTASGTPMSPPNKLYLSATATGTTVTAVAVMPQVNNLQAGTHRLKFKAYASTADKSIEVGYYETADDASSYVFLQAFNLPSAAQSNATEFTYTPENVPSGIQSLIFRLDGTAYTGTSTVYIDDVAWELLPSCFDITSITVSNISASSADIEWNSGGSETAWQYVYGPSAINTTPAGLVPTGIDNTPYFTLEGLTSNTNYNLWIRSNCGGGAFGNWSIVKNFTTACTAETVFPYVIDFESVTVPAIPTCTSIQNAGTGNNWKTASTTSYGFSSKVLNYTYNGTNAANAWFYTNQMALQAGITYKLTYKYGNDSTTYTEKLKVAYGTSAVATDMIEELANHPMVIGGLAQDNSVSFTPATTGNYVIGFNVYSQSDQNNLYVDNIVVDLAPTALPVCATNIVATPNATCGNYATTITWTASPSTNGYNVIIAPTSGGTPVTIDAGNSTTLSYVGNHNTAYTYTVIPYNNIGSAVDCASQTFTTALNGCYCPSLPTSNDALGISNVLIGNQNFVNADNLYFDHTATPVDLAQGIIANLKITLATGYSYHSNVWIDLNDNYIFEENELLFSAPTAELSPFPNPYINDASFSMPIDAPLGQHRMRIVSTDILQTVANSCYSGTYGVTLDFMVNITMAPTCLAPSNASATNITTTSATLNWTASTSTPANGYAYYVTTSTTLPNAATEATGTVGAGVTTAEVSNLVTSSVYKFYIRSVCSVSEASLWTQAGTFTTLCAASPLPYTIDFESVTVPNLPSCTSNQNVGTGNDWKTVSGANYGFTGKYLRYSYNSTNAANTWFFTNVFNLVAGTSYTVSYKYGAGSTSYSEKLKVAYGNAANDASMTTILANHDNVNSNVPQNNSVEFTPTTSGLYVIGFNAYSASNLFYLQVDDIVIMVTPTCVPPAVIPTVTNITATTATLNWTASTSAASEGYDYYYSTATTNPTAATTPLGSVGAGITTANLTGLTAVSTYYVWVRSKCSSTDVSAWSNSATFTTPCTSYDTPFTEGFTPFLPSCWTRASAGTIATGPTNALAGGWAEDGFLNVGTTGAARFNIYGTNRTGWLITPQMNTTVGQSYTFAFDYGITAYTGGAVNVMGSDDTVKVAMSTDNGTTWTQIQNFSAASNITNLLQQFGYTYNATTTSVKFAFIADAGTLNDNQDYNFYVDNVAMDTALSNVEFSKNTLTVYPNPVKNNLNIRYTESIKDVTIYNLLGQQLFTKNINATEGQIDMSNLTSGTYLVKVVSGDKVQTLKVIKE